MSDVGVLAGIPDMNAAAGQSTLGAVMSPEQMADVDWGDSGPPTVINRDPANSDLFPPMMGGQNPGLVPPGSAPPGLTADQIDSGAPVTVVSSSGPPDAGQIDVGAPDKAPPPPAPALPPKSLLDQISNGEGTADKNGRSGYDIIYGYEQTSKPLSQMTLDEVRQLQDQMGNHTPVGRYQITEDTLGDLQDKLGLGDDTIFSPDVQDRMAQQLMADRGHWNDFVNGKIDGAQFGQNLAGTWSSLQDPNKMAQFQSVLSQVPCNK